MEFSWQEYLSVLPCPSPGDLPDPGIQPGSPALQPDALPSELLGKSIHSIQTGKIFCSSRETQLMLQEDATYSFYNRSVAHMITHAYQSQGHWHPWSTTRRHSDSRTYLHIAWLAPAAQPPPPHSNPHTHPITHTSPQSHSSTATVSTAPLTSLLSHESHSRPWTPSS